MNTIYEGDKFLCFKTAYYYYGRDEIIFKEGEIYESLRNEYIVDYNKSQTHHFTENFWKKYLLKLKFLSKDRYSIEEKLTSLQELKYYGYAYNHKTKKIIKKKRNKTYGKN